MHGLNQEAWPLLDQRAGEQFSDLKNFKRRKKQALSQLNEGTTSLVTAANLNCCSTPCSEAVSLK